MMQQVGFTVMFLCFLFGAIFFKQLQKPGNPVKAFQFIYYLSSFFTQYAFFILTFTGKRSVLSLCGVFRFGPNCTTFLLAAEVFPSSVRATAHGFR